MTKSERTYQEIQNKIKEGSAVVLTADEICNRVRSGEKIDFEDVDVVTTATRGIMSGTYAVFSFKVAEPNSFIRASRVWLNDIPAQVGPCPNERLGVLDLIVHGTAHSKSNPTYGGGHLFREIVEGNTITVEIETVENYWFKTYTNIQEMQYAKLFGTRHAFKNYLAFVNPEPESVPSIFHASEFRGNLSDATFCGCGELNPIENDPDLQTIGIGTRVLINGNDGFVTGLGTRSSPEKPNLGGFSDMHKMVPEYMGGFVTSAGPEIINTWAVPIPVINQSVLENVLKLNSKIELKVVDVCGRIPLCKTSYEDVWKDTDNEITYQPDECIDCDICEVERTCPMGAVIHMKGESAVHNPELCFNCGLCVTNCAGKAFNAELGTIEYCSTETKKSIPVVVRQSDRLRALKAAEDLKEKITSREFKISEPVERIHF
ncbi:MAG: methanogenesis marker 16 metalloprotein [Methanohalobium sp.]|uniref:methanogenesis marker 16 metalloprotein n=1 Tax=Methanohalobium sp. TaxID=2837493 RepID=UPI00397CF8ED